MSILKIIIGPIFSIYILVGIFLFIFQRNFVYFPTEEVLHNYKTERLSINEESINIVVLNGHMNDAILYFGGNGESVVKGAADLVSTFPNHTIYLVNYRGYGGSTGVPTEQGLYADAKAIYDIVSSRHENLSVIGRSLGTGVATHLASTRTIKKLILVTPYDSIQHIAQDSYPIYPMSFLLLDKYNSIDRVNQIKSQTLIILAQHDAVIPAKYSSLLIDEFPKSQVQVETIEESGHNDLSNKAIYFQLLKEFIQ